MLCGLRCRCIRLLNSEPLQAYSNSQDKSKFPLETLRQDAQELIKALKAAPPLQNAEPGFFLAFSEYPRATALRQVHVR